jgi:hypothetical protein
MLIWVVIILSTLGHVAGTLVLLVNCKPVGDYCSDTVKSCAKQIRLNR